MAQKPAATLILLTENLKLARASRDVLRESFDRAAPILSGKKQQLDAGERETLEALTARFARFSDFLVQRLFRTLDEHELVAQGTVLDCLNRMEKRGIIPSVDSFREIRSVRNDIAHEYLIEKSDDVVRDAYQKSPLLFGVLDQFEAYLRDQKYL